MLTDAQLERYSRQIVMPDVGGRGQLRLLGAAVTLGGGATDALRVTATLLERAGVGTLHLVGTGRDPTGSEAPLGDVVVDLGGDAALAARAAAARRPFVGALFAATGATLATLVGRPCPACLPAGARMPPDDESAPNALAVTLPALIGALAASEALRVLLTAPAMGRLHRVGLAGGAFVARELASSAPCSSCGGTA